MDKHKNQKLFIGGAGKSGTTFLFSCLGQHPEIAPSNPIDPAYFLDREHPLTNSKVNIHNKGDYASFFTNDEGIYLDGTPHLLYQKEMPDIFKDSMNAKVIFILRHPSERIYSSFNFVKHNLAHFKQEISFLDYTNALLNGKTTLIQSWLRTAGSQYVLSKELEISTYHLHLKRWQAKIGEERISLLTFKDLTTDAKLIADRIFNWLDLPPHELDLNQGINQNTSYQVKNRLLHYWATKLGATFEASIFRGQLKQLYFSLFQRKDQLEKSEGDLLALEQLMDYFRSHNQQLKTMVDLNIEHWSS